MNVTLRLVHEGSAPLTELMWKRRASLLQLAMDLLLLKPEVLIRLGRGMVVQLTRPKDFLTLILLKENVV